MNFPFIHTAVYSQSNENITKMQTLKFRKNFDAHSQHNKQPQHNENEKNKT